MRKNVRFTSLLILALSGISTAILSCKKDDKAIDLVTVSSIQADGIELLAEPSLPIPNTADLVVHFSKDIKEASISDFVLTSPSGVAEAISVTTSGAVATLNPLSDLAESTVYKLEIAKTITAMDGGKFAGKSISFTTDSVPAIPRVTVTSIKSGETELSASMATENIATSADLVVSFSKEVLPVAASQVSLIPAGGTAVSLALSTVGNTTTVHPLNNLLSGTYYTFVLFSGIKAKDGGTFSSRTFTFKTKPFVLDSLSIEGKKVGSARVTDVGLRPEIKAYFSVALDEATVNTTSLVLNARIGIPFTYSLSADKKVVTLVPSNDLAGFTRHTFQINSNLKNGAGQAYSGVSQFFYTKVDAANKFPIISDEELLTLVQRQTFKYFWDFAHPVSGLARERNSSGDLVTSGGSGFGIMAQIVGVERGFITRVQAVERWTKILTFLKKADRFHGVWPHWLNGSTGKIIPFSTNDNGGDLVESAFMIQGLITLKQYLHNNDPVEYQLIGKIDSLCNEVEYDWYRQNNQNVLYWHWSPNLGWIMNHRLQGWNETLITYILAAASTTHSIPKSVYTNGFATGGGFLNGNSYYGIQLPLGPAVGGPLFFAHYSFLGLKPTQLSDPYANYWTQNVNHSKINYNYCVANPKKFVGYGPDCWGLTASDNRVGYNAHSPTNDLGVISPTAALSSFPYTPTESMKAMKFFYYKLGDRMWGQYGFYDAFNATEDWFANSYLAIDQGPIIVMMENHRTGLLWNLFMSAPEVQQGLTKLGFQQ